MQAVASFVGGTVGVILITLLAPLFSQLARNFGPPEYFLLAMMGMLCLVSWSAATGATASSRG